MELYLIFISTVMLFLIGYILGRLNANYTLQNEVKKPKKIKMPKFKKEEKIPERKETEEEKKANHFYQ